MQSPTKILVLLSTVFMMGLGADSAHAGIIVTVGKISVELCPEKGDRADTPGQAGKHRAHERRTHFESEGTRCVELPGGGVECGRAIRVDSLSALPHDWRCVAVSPGVLFCELPTPPTMGQGTGPKAAGAGEYDPTRFDGHPNTATPNLEVDDDGELMALGCTSGGTSTLWGAFVALLMLGIHGRRRTTT